MSDFIESLVDKISAYNIFNYLVPGAAFAVAFVYVSPVTLFSGNVIIDVVVVYIIGMILSRVGSLVIEPLFKWLRIVKYGDYEDFLAAEKKDSKLITLLQESNTYRTMTAVFLVLILVKIGMLLLRSYPSLGLYFDWLLPIGLLALFALSFRKQSTHIRKRVNSAKD
jgi:hypothetical protein